MRHVKKSDLNRVAAFIESSSGDYVATAFFVCIEYSSHRFFGKLRHVYVVTALHCVMDNNYLPRPGQKLVFPWQGSQGRACVNLDELQWNFFRIDELANDEDYCDVAVAPFTSGALSGIRIGETQIPVDLELASPVEPPEVGDRMATSGLVPYYVGGEELIEPMVRFGFASLLPRGRLKGARGRMDAYVVESFSTAGMSGAPVFRLDEDGHCELAGMHVGHFQGQPINVAGRFVSPTHSGLSQVVPTRKIIELLQLPRISERREDSEQHLADQPWNMWFPSWRHSCGTIFSEQYFETPEEYLERHPTARRICVMCIPDPWDLEESFPLPPIASGARSFGSATEVQCKLNTWLGKPIKWERPMGSAFTYGQYRTDSLQLSITLAHSPHNYRSVMALEVAFDDWGTALDVKQLASFFEGCQMIDLDLGSDPLEDVYHSRGAGF